METTMMALWEMELGGLLFYSYSYFADGVMEMVGAEMEMVQFQLF